MRDRWRIYEFYFLFDKWNQPGQCVRDHRIGIYDGLRHCKNAEFCTWRCDHDRRVCCSDGDDFRRASGICGSADRSCFLYPAWNADRTGCIQTASECGVSAGSADHGDRSQLSAPEYRAVDLWSKYQIIYFRCSDPSGCFGGRKSDDHRGDDHDDRSMYRDHDRTDSIYQEIKIRSGNAGCLGGSGRSAADGDQCQ